MKKKSKPIIVFGLILIFLDAWSTVWAGTSNYMFIDDLSGNGDWTATYFQLDKAQIAKNLGLTEQTLVTNGGSFVTVYSVKEDGTKVAPNSKHAGAGGNAGDWHDANGHSLSASTGIFYHVINYSNFSVGIGQRPTAGITYGQSFAFKLVVEYTPASGDPVTVTLDVTYKITYQKAYENAVAEAKAALANNEYAAVTGMLRTNLEGLVNATVDQTEEGWKAAMMDIITALTTFKSSAITVGTYFFQDSPLHNNYVCTYYNIDNHAIAKALGLSTTDFVNNYKADNSGKVKMSTYGTSGSIYTAANDAGEGNYKGYWLDSDGKHSGWSAGIFFFVYDPAARIGIGQMPTTESGRTHCEPGKSYNFCVIFQYNGKKAVVSVTYNTTYKASYETALEHAKTVLGSSDYVSVTGKPRTNLQSLVDAHVAEAEEAWKSAAERITAVVASFKKGVTETIAGTYVLDDSPQHTSYSCKYIDIDNDAIAKALDLSTVDFTTNYKADNSGKVVLSTYDATGTLYTASADAGDGDFKGYWLNSDGKSASWAVGYIYFVYDPAGRIGVGQMPVTESGKKHVAAGDICTFHAVFCYGNRQAIVKVSYKATVYLWLQDVLTTAKAMLADITIGYDKTAMAKAIADGESVTIAMPNDEIMAVINAINKAIADYQAQLKNVNTFKAVVEDAKAERAADSYPGNSAFDVAISTAESFLAKLEIAPTLDATEQLAALNMAREAYYNSQYAIAPIWQTVSYVDLSLNASEKYTLRVDNKPFYPTNIQVRPDKLRGYLGWSEKEIEAAFKRAADDGFNTVSVPVYWKEVEPEKNHFDWRILDRYLGWCKKYGMKMEMLWFSWSSGGRVQWLWNGTNGKWVLRTPDYVCSADGKSDFNMLRNTWEYSLDWRDTNLRSRETYVLGRIMEHIALWDANNDNPHTVVGVQLGNEARGHGNNSATAAEIVDYYHQVGSAVKNSKYVTWTRINCVSYETSGRTSANENKRNNGGTNIDFVGIDVYGTNAGSVKGNINGQLGTNGKNYRMIMEIDAKDSWSPIYQMAALAGDKAFDYYNLGPVDGNGLYANDGHALKERAHINLVRQRNKMLNLCNQDICLRKQGSGLYVYNYTATSTNTEAGYKGITFTPGANNTQAIAVEHSSHEFSLLSTADGTFTIPSAYVIKSAEIGHYDSSNNWVKEGYASVEGQTIKMSGTSCVRVIWGTSSKKKVFTCGDSTMAPKSSNTERGWGMLFSRFLDANHTVVDNRALDGYSTKSFIDKGKWLGVTNSLSAGDYVLIQFGHNDAKTSSSLHTDPQTTYKHNLAKMVAETRAKHATPVLLTPIVRRTFGSDGNIVNDHTAYAEAMRQVADSLDVPLIDMNLLSSQYENVAGIKGSRSLHEYYPGTEIDNTHLCQFGAYITARCVAEQIALNDKIGIEVNAKPMAMAGAYSSTVDFARHALAALYPAADTSGITLEQADAMARGRRVAERTAITQKEPGTDVSFALVNSDMAEGLCWDNSLQMTTPMGYALRLNVSGWTSYGMWYNDRVSGPYWCFNAQNIGYTEIRQTVSGLPNGF